MKLRLDSVYISVIAVLVAGLALFSYGFFPLSHSSKHTATRFDLPKSIGELDLDHSSYTSHFHRLILMVIDALRWDFIAESDRMTYLNNLIRRNESCLIKMRVHAPTVTMPRIKAMTSGTVPNFIDLILNFGASEMNVDNLIWQMKSQGKIVFYGDNTWTKLFPSTFTRQGENVDSLFVNDFYEGDKNVTDRLTAELVHPDWKMLILHYLGLDHIGHVEGPFSDKVPGKLEEMDKQVTKIVTAMAKWKLRTDRPSLFLLTGDHGMRDTGGHGGSSPGETFVPLVVTGTECESSETVYNQIDLATTVSVLMGLPIPYSSIGTIIPELISGITPEQQLFAFYYNGERLLSKVREQFRFSDFGELEFFKQHQEAVELSKLLLVGNATATEMHLFKRARMLYTASAQEMSEMLSQTFLKYELASISLGIIIVVSATLILIAGLFKDPCETLQINLKPRDCVMSLLVGMLLKHTVCKLFPIDSELFRFNVPMNLFFLALVLILFYLYKVMRSLLGKITYRCELSFMSKFIIFVTFLHLVSLGASSFIEEEHQLWYYLCSTLFIVLFVMQLKLHAWHGKEFILFKFPSDVEKMRKKGDLKGEETLLKNIEKCHNCILGFILLTLTHVVVRRLNQTGDKWAHLKDIGDLLMEQDNKVYLTILVTFAMILTCVCLHSLGGLLTNILTFTALLLVFFYRSSIGQVLVFNTVFSSPKMPVILFWCNVLEIILIEFMPFFYRTLIQRSVNRIDLGRFMGSLVTVFAVISVLLYKPHNIILVPVCVLTCRWVKGKVFAIWSGATERTIFIIATHFWIGKMFFFYQGNSNSLATIDLNAGYIGLETYHPVLVGLLLTLNTFSGPILTSLLALCHIFEQVCSAISLSTLQFEQLQATISVNLLRIQSVQLGLPVTVYLIVATLFRNHLFVWTVFSPKLIYELYSFALYVVLWLAFYGWTRVTRGFAKIIITS